MTKMTTMTTTTRARKKTWPLVKSTSATLNVEAALGVAALTHRLTELGVGDTVGTEDRGYGRQGPKEQAELSRCYCARALALHINVESIFNLLKFLLDFKSINFYFLITFTYFFYEKHEYRSIICKYIELHCLYINKIPFIKTKVKC